MADTPIPKLFFRGTCPDCGEREINLPPPLPDPGDDFDWQVRDYDGFRRFLLEELVARFPERTRWTAGDIEVVLIEVLAAVLDQLSDMADRVHAEKHLETARRPGTVRRLLRFIGYDAVAKARAAGVFQGKDEDTSEEGFLDMHWLKNPQAMEAARQEGPELIQVQHRMVTEADYATRLNEHPLVLRAQAQSEWTGSWSTISVAVLGFEGVKLDEVLSTKLAAETMGAVQSSIKAFHAGRGLVIPDWAHSQTIRTVLSHFLERYRMAGQEVFLRDITEVAILISVSVRVDPNFFQSEVRHAVLDALGTGSTGFFARGRLAFGEDLHASDLIAAVMSVEGVETVCLNRFKRIGAQFADQSNQGRIILQGLEVPVCDNDSAHPERGYIRMVLHGGKRG